MGFAVAVGMKEYQEILDYEKLVELSPRFVYAEAKEIDSVPGLEGTTIRAAMQVLKKLGVCQEKFWPYKPHQEDKPKEGAAINAKKFCVITYQQRRKAPVFRHGDIRREFFLFFVSQYAILYFGRRTFGVSLWSGDVGHHCEAGTPNTKALDIFDVKGISWRIP